MKTTELRIGNLVTLDEKQRTELWENEISAISDFFKIDTIYSDGEVVLKLDNENVDFDETDIIPIPLTEGWLRKFNAESYFTSDPQETQSSKAFKFGDIKIHMCNEDVEEFMFESFEFVKIKTVHQLQNLYFALTGEELTYENLT